MSIRQQLFYSLRTLALILAFFEATSVDLWLQDHFYNASATDLHAARRAFLKPHAVFHGSFVDRYSIDSERI